MDFLDARRWGAGDAHLRESQERSWMMDQDPYDPPELHKMFEF